MTTEFSAVGALLRMLVLNPRTGVLMGLLVIAAVSDMKTGRIPNWLVFGGALYGVSYNAFVPVSFGENGFLFALGGLCIGLGALLPLHLLRMMGAGDVKLMAMTGAFLGTSETLAAVLATLLAGGVLAVAFALHSGRMVRMLRNLALVLWGTALTWTAGPRALLIDERSSAGRMPYAVAIAAGTIGYLIATQLGLL
jgi:prepilin peptidase CpaA